MDVTSLLVTIRLVLCIPMCISSTSSVSPQCIADRGDAPIGTWDKCYLDLSPVPRGTASRRVRTQTWLLGSDKVLHVIRSHAHIGMEAPAWATVCDQDHSSIPFVHVGEIPPSDCLDRNPAAWCRCHRGICREHEGRVRLHTTGTHYNV